MLRNTTQTDSSKNGARNRADKALRATTLAICVLIAEGILAAGTCALTQNLMDQWNTDWLRHTQIAVDLMGLVAAILILVDVVVMGLFLLRPPLDFPRLPQPLPARATPSNLPSNRRHPTAR